MVVDFESEIKELEDFKPESLMRREYSDSEDRQENILRPQHLEDFQGQQEIKDNLEIFIKAARKRKTTLASIIANEMNADIRMTSAPALDKPKDLAGILTNLSENSIFFIDEIHRLKPVIEEMLYIAMEDYEIDWVIGQGPAARTMRIPLPHFTLIGATTKAGNVSSPLASRFGINIHIDFYNDEELAKIIKRSSHILKCDIDDDALLLLAHCSRGTPRIANRLLRRLRDFALVLSDGRITKETVKKGLERLGIDNNGLEKMDRQILRTIIEYYNGGPVGADTLSISVGEAVESLEDFYEPYLIQQGYLKRTPRGRCVTDKAYKLLNMKGGGYVDEGLLF